MVNAFRSVAAAVVLVAAGPAWQGPGTVLDCLRGGEVKALWRLPPAIREVSGLALTDDGRLLAHNDERGLVAALDAATGRVIGTYHLGATPLLADFEGIAVVGQKMVLTTSDGVLYEADLPPKAGLGGVLKFVVTPTGVGAHCEVEGLAYDQADRVLLLACKSPRGTSDRKQVAVFRWNPAGRTLARPDRVTFDERELSRNRPGKQFRPSAIEIDPRTGAWVMIASADNAVAMVDRSGRVLGNGMLGGKHRQPEGLALGPDGSVYVSDEGGDGPGKITVYACR